MNKEKAKEYRKENKEKAKEYREENKGKAIEYREEHKEKIKELKKKFAIIYVKVRGVKTTHINVLGPMLFSNVMNVTMNSKERKAKWTLKDLTTFMSTFAPIVILSVLLREKVLNKERN